MNEPYPSSHPLNEGNSLVFLIQKEEDALISLTKSADEIEGGIYMSPLQGSNTFLFITPGFVPEPST